VQILLPEELLTAPSATRMTAWARSRSGPEIAKQARGRPPDRNRLGIRTKLTSRKARQALAAMNPAWRPMSLTRPMPLGAPRLRCGAARMASGHLHCGIEAEGAAHQGNVVVNGLGDDDDAGCASPGGQPPPRSDWRL